MGVELVSPATPLEVGDAALVNRGGSPAMVELGTAAESDVTDFATSGELATLSANTATNTANIVSLDADLTTAESNLNEIRGITPAAPAGSLFVSDGSGGGEFIRVQGWGQYGDDRDTSGSPAQVVANSVRTQFICNSLGENLEKLPSDSAGSLWNSSSNIVEPISLFDTYTIRVSFKVQGYAGSTPDLSLDLDIGGAIGVIWKNTVPLLKGGVEQALTWTIPVYSGSTFIANGGTFNVTYTGTGSVNIYDNQLMIRRESKNYV